MLLKCRGLKSVCHFWFHNHEHPAFQDLALLVSILLTQNWACVRSFHNHHMVPRKSFRYLQFPRACSRFKTWICGWQSFTPGQAIFRGLFPTSPVLSAFIQKMGSISRQADPQWNPSQQIRCYVFWFKMFALAIEVYGNTRFLIISLNIFIHSLLFIFFLPTIFLTYFFTAFLSKLFPNSFCQQNRMLSFRWRCVADLKYHMVTFAILLISAIIHVLPVYELAIPSHTDQLPLISSWQRSPLSGDQWQNPREQCGSVTGRSGWVSGRGCSEQWPWHRAAWFQDVSG